MMEHPDEFNKLMHDWLEKTHLQKYNTINQPLFEDLFSENSGYFFDYLCTNRISVMKINTAEFIVSNSEVSKCPQERLPEYAFIGRSNVGKSSLINMLTNHKSLAKTSGRPGKTQLINHFKINNNWFLVDLPGYGYARVSKKRRKFSRNLLLIISRRENNWFVLLC